MVFPNKPNAEFHAALNKTRQISYHRQGQPPTEAKIYKNTRILAFRSLQ